MYKALGTVGNRNLLVAGIYNCVGLFFSKSKVLNMNQGALTCDIDLMFIVFFIDRVGRRKPLLFGTIGITFALIYEAVVNS
jgi:hypothetical protein